jgi:hypothetical protein
MQVLERAADLSGVSIGEVQQATLQLTKRLSQAASGSGAAAKALQNAFPFLREEEGEGGEGDTGNAKSPAV